MCGMLITFDNEFFNKIGLEETKRYFQESYKFVCNYKNLGEQNIISAVVHLDETAPHMHLIYIPVIQDKEEKLIDKICARDFWRGRDSYRIKCYTTQRTGKTGKTSKCSRKLSK